MQMANELVMQVMRELARRSDSGPMISVRGREASSSCFESRPALKPDLGLDSREERFLRCLAAGGRTSDGAGGVAVGCPAEGRSMDLCLERGRETRAPKSAVKAERCEMRVSRQPRFIKGRSAIGLDELAERLEGRDRP